MSAVADNFLVRLKERGLPGEEALAEFKAGFAN